MNPSERSVKVPRLTVSDIFVQNQRLILRQYANRINTGIDTVGQGKINDAELAAKGVKFAPGEKWGILAARYNYSHYMYRRQTSSFPELPIVSFHLRQYYAPVIFR